MSDQQTDNSAGQAQAQLDSIRAMVANLEPVECERCGKWHRDLEGEYAADSDTCLRILEGHEIHESEDEAIEAAERAIQEDALSVEVRSDWYTLGEDQPPPSEFTILLCTGGPAVRILGELDESGLPCRAWLEHQDWGTPWTEYHADHDTGALLAYASRFLFAS